MGDGEGSANPQPPPEPEGLLTLQEAAEQLKVHYMTAYRWVRRGDLEAFKAGGRLRIRSADLERFIANRQVDPAAPRAGQRTDWPTHVERLHQSLRVGDSVGALRLVRKVIANGAPVADVYVRLLAPALHRIGDDWSREDICIAEEHRATEIATTILKRHSDAFRRRGPRRGSAVSMAAPPDRHSIAAAMVADFLRGGGYDVSYLGAAVPIDDLAVFLRGDPADVVCLSVTTSGLASSAYTELAETARQGKADATVVFGGRSADRAAAEAAGAVYHDDLYTLTEALSRLPAP